MIIIDIPMPENCSDCPCNNDYVDCGINHKSFYNDEIDDPFTKRPEWCPLIEMGTKDGKWKMQIFAKEEGDNIV